MFTGAIIFDAFGTIYELQAKKQPFVKLARASERRRDVLHAVMTRPMALGAATAEFASGLVDLNSLDKELAVELESIRLFSDADECLMKMNAAVIKIGIVSRP
ncbi:hypothetical protein [Burkholderia glumae]|uniref:hypothetical protein n=1 Tax=Burkholderia glumae TaxID=337 RepID=UPI002036A1F0|nr:hypothetical protein [Burkholderia glumae]MCM2549985.1 hypothetical protein [Burkholderia glumae]